jgi:chromosome segregation ATPase
MENLVDDATREQFQHMLDAAIVQLDTNVHQYVNTTIDGLVRERATARAEEFRRVYEEIGKRATLGEVTALVESQAKRWRESAAWMIDKALGSKLTPITNEFAQIRTLLANLTGQVQVRLSGRDEGLLAAQTRVDEFERQMDSRYEHLQQQLAALTNNVERLTEQHNRLFASVHGDPTVKDGSPSLVAIVNQLTETVRLQATTDATRRQEIEARLARFDRFLEAQAAREERRRQLMRSLWQGVKAAPLWFKLGLGLIGGGGVFVAVMDWLNQLF